MFLSSRGSSCYLLKRSHFLKVKIQSKSLSSIDRNTLPDFVVWDSFNKKFVPLTSKHPNILTWYSCGPTVYDSAHLGHASSYIRQDVVRRILENLGGEISIVQLMGVTDIDDKIINKANQLGKPWDSISRKFDKEFFENLASLNVKPPHLQTRVTDFIPQIINFVSELVEKGLAYPVSDGSVYFDTERFDKYGKFRKLSEEAEVEDGQEKKSRKDFAVWKGWKPSEPFWTTPWGKGRPGWHIECSVMASHFFGSNLDIHTGGVDLIFPHHENEEAQCCARYDVNNWVSHWFHFGHLNMKGDVKMSKSLGNTLSISDFLKENSAKTLRMFCIQSKYQNSLEFSTESLGHAKSILRKFESFMSDTDAIIRGIKVVQMTGPGLELWNALIKTRKKVYQSLTNDFDTPSAIHMISEFIDTFNRNFTMNNPSPLPVHPVDPIDYGLVLSSGTFVQDFMSLVGIEENGNKVGIDSKSQSYLLEELVQFRSRVRNFALAFDETDKKVRKEKVIERKDLIEACDDLRIRLDDIGVDIKDHGKLSSVSSSLSKS